MPLAMMHVDDADGSALVDQRHRKKRLVGVFHQGGEHLEARVLRGPRRQRHRRLVLRHPARHALAHLHAQVAQVGSVRHQRSAQNEFARLCLHQIHQAGVAAGHPRRQSHDLPQHLIQRQFRANNPAHSVQNGYVVGSRDTHSFGCHHTSSVRRATGLGPIKTFYQLNHRSGPV